jgi:phosphate-selective porin
MTTLRIKTASFRLVTPCLEQMSHRVPLNNRYNTLKVRSHVLQTHILNAKQHQSQLTVVAK